jgi:hypothetical protein
MEWRYVKMKMNIGHFKSEETASFMRPLKDR